MQVVASGQLVEADWPSNRATIWPVELRKLVPVMVTVCPVPPDDGLSEVRTGAPPAEGPVVVVPAVVVVVDLRGAVVGTVPDRRAGAPDPGVPWPAWERPRAMAAATRRAATRAITRTQPAHDPDASPALSRW